MKDCFQGGPFFVAVSHDGGYSRVRFREAVLHVRLLRLSRGGVSRALPLRFVVAVKPVVMAVKQGVCFGTVVTTAFGCGYGGDRRHVFRFWQ
jgi:hypothetical protein